MTAPDPAPPPPPPRPGPQMRVALFGGSFDPPHRGHVAIAAAAALRFALDSVLFAPAGRQPLKPEGSAAPYPDRLAMVTLACSASPSFAPCDLDAPLPGGAPNYTVRTLERLTAQYPQAQLLCLVGADTFRGLAHWYEPQTVLALAEWIVVSRPGFVLADPEGMNLTPAQRQRIHRLDSVHEDVSATTLRERLATGDGCEDLLPAGVPGYIQQHRLYRTL